MKSYFAKLADRATLANVPARSAVYAPRVSDPFENSSQPPTQLPPPEKSRRTEFAREPVGLVSAPLEDSQTKRGRPLVETHKRTTSDPTPETPPLQPLQLPDSLVSERTVRGVTPEPRSFTAQPQETVGKREVSRVEVLTPTEAPEASVFHAPAQTPKDSDAALNDERIAELKRDQAVLQRRADFFMSSLLDAHRQPADKSETKVVDASSPTSITRTEPDPISRLEPVQRLPRVTAQDSDGPSLVIGKLTVEVTPPTPPPAPAQPQRVVVRGFRGRGSGVTSGRRFGLGQF